MDAQCLRVARVICKSRHAARDSQSIREETASTVGAYRPSRQVVRTTETEKNDAIQNAYPITTVNNFAQLFLYSF
jgi:hypothetical protein